jgi:hypothetical protein
MFVCGFRPITVLQDYFFAGQLKPVVRGTPMLLSFSKPVVTHDELYEMVCLIQLDLELVDFVLAG